MDDQVNTSNVETTENDATVAKISSIWQALQQRWSPWRSKALKNYEYVIGNQIDKATREKLAKEHRPALVFNLLNPLVVYIAGTLISNKTTMRAVPLRMGDEKSSEMHGVLVGDWALPQCNGYEEIAKASLDAAITGIGCTNNRWDVRKDPEGTWITESFDPLMVMFDPDVRKLDQSDWRYYTVSGFYTCEEILSIHDQHLTPEMKQIIQQRAKDIEGRYQRLGMPIGFMNRVWQGSMEFLGIRDKKEEFTEALITDYVDARSGLYRVIEFHDRRLKKVKVLYDPATRERIEIPNEEQKPVDSGTGTEGDDAATPDQQKLAEALAKHPNGIIYETMSDELWETAIVPGLYREAPIFELPYEVQDAGWQHKLIIAHDFHPDITKVTSLTDPVHGTQDSFNQRRMTILELLMDMVHPPIEAPEKSISPENEDAWINKERGPIRFYKTGMKPERVYPPANLISGLSGFAEEDRDLTSKLTGATPNLQGYAESSNEPSSLYAQRIQQGMVMLNYFFSHIQLTQKMIFRYCDKTIQKFMTGPRAVRILGEPVEGMEGAELGLEGMYWMKVNWPTLEGVLNDVKQGEYDFVVDTQHLGPTQKMIQRMEVLEMIKTIPPQLVLWPEVFKLWDSPLAVKFASYAQKMMGIALQDQQVQKEKSAVVGDMSLLEKANQLKAGVEARNQQPKQSIGR